MKASEIFIKYAEPLINEVTSDYVVEEHLKKALNFPVMIWNSLVMREWNQSKIDFIQAMRDQFKSAPSDFRKNSIATIDLWVKRKQDLFPDAKWAFEIKVRPGKEGPIIRALTRIPDHLKHTVPVEWQSDHEGAFHAY